MAWAVASPIHAVPDEPDQVKRAVSVWQGQLLGPRVDGQPSVVRSITIDGSWDSPPIPCFAFHPELSPTDCPAPFPADRAQVSTTTYDGAFPPLYYGAVGWVSRLTHGARGVRAMRFVSAALASALLASAVGALSRVVRPHLALLGVAGAVAPMVFFLAGSVNPNGLEIAAAIGLWAHVLALGRWRGGDPEPQPVPVALAMGFAVSGATLALTRFLSPGFAVLIIVVGIATASTAEMGALLRDRRVRFALGAVVAAVVIGSGMTLATGALEGLSGAVPAGSPNPALTTLGLTGAFIEQMLGWFGWLDTPISQVTLFGWLLLIGSLIGGAVLLGRRRTVGLLLSTVALTLAVPWVIQAPRLLEYGLTWQGRHGLPLAVGIPLLAVVAIDDGVGVVTAGVRRLALLLASVIAVVQVHALWWALPRYTVGPGSQALGLVGGRWQPPGGSLPWLASMAAFGVALIAAMWWTAGHDLVRERRVDLGARQTGDMAAHGSARPPRAEKG
jgi:hypothetical protein